MKYRHPSSYKDPSGYIFIQKSRLFREIDGSFIENYIHLMKSGLYDRLVKEALLIPHHEISTIPKKRKGNKIIEPVNIPWISYPYEWCFSQLKDAALLTLQIQKIALEYGMSLRDASSFNTQIYNGAPIFIDTLSFALYEEGKPWVAYKQFCEYFLAPLSLMAYKDVHLSFLLEKYIDGIPLDVAIRLLPWYRKLHPGLLVHIVFHALSQKRRNSKFIKVNTFFSKTSLMGLLESLESTVQSISWQPDNTPWFMYTKKHRCISYTASSLLDKKKIVKKYLTLSRPTCIWDVGANTGDYSQLACELGISVVSLDTDASVIEHQYQHNRTKNIKNILPLCVDVMNPTPSIGWRNEERMAFLHRSKPDLIMVLAMLHHLVIGNNLPLKNIAEFFSNITKRVIIEFIPKTDVQVKEMLQVRQDIFSEYTQNQFESIFSQYFVIMSSKKIKGSERTIYLLKRKTK